MSDLRHESDRLTEWLSGLAVEQWGLATPAVGWAIGDQVTHLAFFDDATLLAMRSPAEFRAFADTLMAEGMDFPDRIAESHRTLTPQAMLTWFIDSRADLLDRLSAQDPKARLPWFGPDMSTASCATARLMETWAHGRDVYDALGVEPPPSPGLRSIAHLGVSTFAFSHTVRGITVPDEPVYVELRSAAGELWSWGPSSAANRVHGPAEDFALVVTQRRHWTQTALVVEGPVATQWLDIAQAFAGAPSRRAVPQ
ncbi:TIGR03084 family metal-binding protein [Mycobacterium avium]|uniref:TIGR03084 family metal-binding protein n=1 Tax=Mycobacterium avium TaxID=1764 RepID=UPI001E3EBF36|nr:TIGR03084 family metal-binding protein [Mycobacterium avium]